MSRLSLTAKLSNKSLIEKLHILDDCLNKDIKNYQDLEDQMLAKSLLANLLPDVINPMESNI